MDTKTKTVEAFGYRWVFAENTKWADLTRRDLEQNARNYALKTYKRPAEQRAVWVRFLPYWPNIMSSAVEVYKLENPPKEEAELTEPKYTFDNGYLMDLMNNASKWEALMLSVEENGLEEELFALHDAARECNPHWKKEEENEPIPPEVEAAATEVEKAYTFLAKTDESDELPPDTDAVVGAVASVVEHHESVARKKAS